MSHNYGLDRGFKFKNPSTLLGLEIAFEKM